MRNKMEMFEDDDDVKKMIGHEANKCGTIKMPDSILTWNSLDW